MNNKVCLCTNFTKLLTVTRSVPGAVMVVIIW